MNNNFSSGLDAGSSTYNSALEYLYGRLPMFSRIGAAAYKPGLETSYSLAEAFGNPHKCFRSIHIGGTNGKGSTSHNLASILQEAGLKTGLYTSPHLVDFRERIRIDGKMIPKETVVEFVERWKKMDYDGSPSFFELTMMMAFEWFAAKHVDVAVIEVGMGGRLDSTNILTPEYCVITNISKDHTQFLGSTLRDIAKEKGGIIKPCIPVMIGEAEGEVRRVFIDKADDERAEIVFACDHPEWFYDVEVVSPAGWQGRSDLYKGIEIVSPLGGVYQIPNIRTVLGAANGLQKIFPVTDRNVVDGIRNVVANTGLAGRWMVMGDNPLTICDTGHNEAGLTYNVGQLRKLMEKRPAGARLRMVIGFVADKAIDEILELLPKDAVYYLTNAQIPRALPVAELEKKCKAIGLNCNAYADVQTAVAAATLASTASTPSNSEAANSEDIIFIGGSTFIVADYLATLSI